jgi:hypothetical protein
MTTERWEICFDNDFATIGTPRLDAGHANTLHSKGLRRFLMHRKAGYEAEIIIDVYGYRPSLRETSIAACVRTIRLKQPIRRQSRPDPHRQRPSAAVARERTSLFSQRPLSQSAINRTHG